MTTLVSASNMALHKAFGFRSITQQTQLGFSAYILGVMDKGVQAMHYKLIVPIK
jgi:hypothetical protein